MQYTLRKVSNTLDTVLRRWAREQGKSLNEVALEALARGAGLTGRTVRQRDRHFDALPQLLRVDATTGIS
jgi:hypothetical protein